MEFLRALVTILIAFAALGVLIGGLYWLSQFVPKRWQEGARFWVFLLPAAVHAQDGEDAPEEEPAAPADDDGPGEGGRKGEGQPDLVALLDPLLDAKGLEKARMSVFIGRADGGDPLYTYQADEALHPASNTKLVITAEPCSKSLRCQS